MADTQGFESGWGWRRVAGAVGAAVASVVLPGAAQGYQPPADPELVRELLSDVGLPAGAGPAGLAAAVRRFQAGAGLVADGVAGPRTVHGLSQAAADARELRAWGLVPAA
jgi:peptidoglycan hydrolase-like protein with peptidoglycan-binding domain